MTFWLSETRIANWLCSDPKTPDQSISSRLEGDFWCQTFFLIFVYNASKKMLRTKFFAWSFSPFWNTKIPSLPNKTFPHLSDSPKLCHAFALESYLRRKMWFGSPPSPTTSHHKIESTNLIQWGCLWPFIESCREGFFRQNQSIDEDNSGWLSDFLKHG